MYLVQYQMLQGSWKAHFDFLSLKKTDHKDISPFKLNYNEMLFKVIFDDQKLRVDKGKNHYQAVAQELFDLAEKESFVRNKKGISLESMEGVILESEIIKGVHLQEIGEHRYPLLMIKCYASTLTLNDDELVFLTTALPCHVDKDSGGLTIAVASIPFMKKSSPKKEEMIYIWAQRKAIEQLRKYYGKVFKVELPRKKLINKMLNFIEDTKIKYFL